MICISLPICNSEYVILIYILIYFGHDRLRMNHDYTI